MRKITIIILIIIIIGLAFAFFIQNIYDPVAGDIVLLFIGEVNDKQMVDEFDYPGGIMEEYLAYDEKGNRVGIYYDQDTRELQGFWLSIPPATEVTINQKQAEDIATDLASEISFFDDPNITLLKSELIDHGSGTDKYYYFYWAAVDDTSGAILLRHIEIRLNAETGQIFYLNQIDEGTVNIETEPVITALEASEIAVERAAKTFVDPLLEEPLLFVTTAYNDQRLVWGVSVEETGDPDNIAHMLYIFIDALTGEIIENEEVDLNDTVEHNDEESEETLKSEDLVNYLDKTALEIVSLHGQPDVVSTHQVSVFWKFSEKSISYFFDMHYFDKDLPFNVEETARVIAVSSWKRGTECYGTKLGMTFSEIESAMGKKGVRYEDHESDYTDDITLYYHLMELKEGINDVELRFYAEDDKSPTHALLIIWKGFEVE